MKYDGPPEFWLGSRLESAVTDYDGRLRRCVVVGASRTEYGSDVILAEVDPPLPGQPPGGMGVFRRHVPADAWRDMAERWLDVWPATVEAPTIARVVGDGSELLLGAEMASLDRGEVAVTPDLLPPTPEELWEEGFAKLHRFVAREGHARVPRRHVEDGYNLGIWAANQRLRQAKGFLPQSQAARLEALPGWEW